MISRIMVSIAVGLALVGATVRLPAAMCILENTSSPKACQMDCCGNKTCCLTSQERSAPTKQPLTKAQSEQQNIAAIAMQNGTRLPVEVSKEPGLLSSAETCAHSQPTLALSCIRLI